MQAACIASWGPLVTPAELEATELARSFETMGLEDLRAEWRARYGAPPTLRAADLLRRMLAWRVQADAMGGLERKLVREILHQAARPNRRKLPAPVGARISREWKGRAYEVQVIEGGYVLDGVTFDSLSAVARSITGTRWNGPKFFGLREEAKS
jgi:hypothetical protein